MSEWILQNVVESSRSKLRVLGRVPELRLRELTLASVSILDRISGFCYNGRKTQEEATDLWMKAFNAAKDHNKKKKKAYDSVNWSELPKANNMMTLDGEPVGKIKYERNRLKCELWECVQCYIKSRRQNRKLAKEIRSLKKSLKRVTRMLEKAQKGKARSHWDTVRVFVRSIKIMKNKKIVESPEARQVRDLSTFSANEPDVVSLSRKPSTLRMGTSFTSLPGLPEGLPLRKMNSDLHLELRRLPLDRQAITRAMSVPSNIHLFDNSEFEAIRAQIREKASQNRGLLLDIEGSLERVRLLSQKAKDDVASQAS